LGNQCHNIIWSTIEKNFCLNQQNCLLQKVSSWCSIIKLTDYCQQYLLDERWRLFNFVECSSKLWKKLRKYKNKSLDYRKRSLEIALLKINWLIKSKLEKDFSNSCLVRSWWLSCIITIMRSWSLSTLFQLGSWLANESCWYVWCWYSSLSNQLSYFTRIVETWIKWANFW